MNNYRCTKEGEWYSPVVVELTEEQKTLLKSKDKNDLQQINELRQLINEQSRNYLEEGDLKEELQNLYNLHKPELNDGVFNLIAVDIFGEIDNFIGIINYRENDNHKQIRF